MRKYTIYALLLLMTLFGGLVSSLIRMKMSQDPAQEINACKIVFPDAQNFSEKIGTPPHYMAYKIDAEDGVNKIIGYTFLTTDLVPDSLGYAGAIKVMVGMDIKGSITRIYVVSHSETPSYVMTLDEFIQQFSLKDTTQAFQLGQDIDGMSRATISSEAITRSVEISFKTMAASLLNIQSTDSSHKKKPFPLSQIFIPLIIFVFAIIGLLRNNITLRWFSLIGGLIYLGFIKSTMVSVVQVANIALLKIPPFASNPLWYCLLFLTLITSLSLGMIYCGCVCPFGAIQEIIYTASKKNKGVQKFSISIDIDQRARHIKYIILLCSLVASFILGNASPAALEPFLTFFTANATRLGWIFLIFILVISIFDFRFWCKYLCPIGALTGLLARQSVFKIKPGSECTGCDACEKICPTRAISMEGKKPVINYAECILCGKCTEKCPRKSLTNKNVCRIPYFVFRKVQTC